MPSQQPARRRSSSPPVSIPDKLYFRIGDVSRLCSLPAYVLRFWESEFPQLKPNKGGTGQRLYRKRDIEVVLEIKRLLYDEGFTIPGARRLLSERRRSGASGASDSVGPQTVPEKSDHARQASRSALSAVEATSMPKGTVTASKLHALREEIRELLVLLGSNPAEQNRAGVPAKRVSKRSTRSDEPTLF